MSTNFITQNIWPQLTKAVRGSRQRATVAVAYFGAGASRLLPLPRGSRLVVDASDRAVASGQTCPADLGELVKRGVKVFSVPNLHAKVFVLGRTAYIGSTNASKRSALLLVEAAIRTTEPGAVRAARRFVRELCLHELTPKLLQKLAELYRPPHVPGGKRGKKPSKETFSRPTLPRLLLAQLEPMNWSERDQSLHDAALPVAKNRREHPRSFELESFGCLGKCAYQRGDLVISLTNEGGGSVLVAPPGNVLHVRTRRNGNRQLSFVFVERPARKRRQKKVIALALGGDAEKALGRNGVVQNAAFARALLDMWANS